MVKAAFFLLLLAHLICAQTQAPSDLKGELLVCGWDEVFALDLTGS